MGCWRQDSVRRFRLTDGPVIIYLKHIISPSGEKVEKRIEIRINLISERTSRIALGRSDEKDPGTERLPLPPPNANDAANCAFCRPQVVL